MGCEHRIFESWPAVSRVLKALVFDSKEKDKVRKRLCGCCPLHPWDGAPAGFTFLSTCDIGTFLEDLVASPSGEFAAVIDKNDLGPEVGVDFE
jgi:hypothetical protein